MRFLVHIIVAALLLSAYANLLHKKVEIRGVYGHPQQLWDSGYKLNELGINAVFVHDKSINSELMLRARKEKVKVYAEFATLNGKGYVENHPEAWAIDSSGNKVQAATWFMGVCPSDPGFRTHRIEALKHLLDQYDVAGVWMDYVHWHAQFEDPEPILPETCFCDKCIRNFQQESGINVAGKNTSDKAAFILLKHDSAWRNWRCEVIAGWAKEFRQVIKQHNPELLLGLYHCPWNDEDFNQARYRILGLDYSLLMEHVDVFSPMVYHKRMGRSPEWVKENIEWFSKIVGGKRIWPIVQAHNDPGKIDADEFRNIMNNGLSGNASGIMMFTTSSVAEDRAKLDVMRNVYDSLLQVSKQNKSH